MPMCSDYIHIPHLSIPTEFFFASLKHHVAERTLQ